MHSLLSSLKDMINYYCFILKGKKPWRRGYDIYRKKQIINTITNSSFNPNNLATGYGFRLDERVVEYPWLFSMLSREKGKLLDAGSALNYDYLLELEPLRSKNIFISTLEYEGLCSCNKGVSHIYEDLRLCCYRDNYFDFIVSISTIEHIGLDNTFLYTHNESKKENAPDSYLLAIKEFRRVLKDKSPLYLSFPFGRHKNHGWFQVFDSEMLDCLIHEFSPKTVKEFHFRYEPEGWKVSSREESKDCTYFDIQVQKHYDSDYAAGSRAIVCLEMIK